MPLRNLHRLWGPYWPLALSPLWFLLFLIVSGDARAEHYIIIAPLTALAMGTPGSRRLLIAATPGIGIAFGYELIRYLRPLFVTGDRILGCEVQALEQALLGFGTGLTPADVFTLYNSPAADLFFALPYTLFWGAVVVYAIALFFLHRARMHRYLWILALTHAVAFVIWLWLPVAPPWYIREYGCQIDPAARPGAAALMRLDARFGISYFHDFYSRAPTVFGALPSLHVAFPAAALAATWRSAGAPERALHLWLTLWMLAASVYLDHHWLVDGLLTLFIIAVIYALLRLFWPGFDRDAPRPEGSPA